MSDLPDCNDDETDDIIDRILDGQLYKRVSGRYNVDLDVDKIARGVKGRTTGWRLRIKAVNPCNMDPNVFVYQRFSDVYALTGYTDRAIKVASLVDMEDLPVGDPGDGDYYRFDVWDMIMPNILPLKRTLFLLYVEVSELVKTFDANDRLCFAGTLSCGNPNACSSSSSSSSSS